MKLRSLLIANRGEIAVRIARAAASLGIETVAVHPADDEASRHVRRATRARRLEGAGPAAYLDAEQVVAIAVAEGCDSVHPGYGFLAENADFAARCERAGLTFVGPSAEVLRALGDKVEARRLAARCRIPVLAGTDGASTPAEIAELLRSLGPNGAVMLKAVAGGGGRGMRAVHSPAEIADAFERCASEARKFFGNPDVYAERLLIGARHIEVQIVGDGSSCVHVWERECSLQRRHQKLVEVAPAPNLDAGVRRELLSSAVRLATEVGYRGLGTFEFLVESSSGEFAFMEANPRLQVEHPVTEAVTGIDLVQAQLRIAGGETLAELALDGVPEPRGFAVEARVNMETMAADGTVRPAGGTLEVFEPPTGPGVRVDTFAYGGYVTSPAYDSLLAKVIVASRSDRFEDAVDACDRALGELRVVGVATNAGFLRSLLRRPEVRAGLVHTRFVDEHVAELAASGEQSEPSPLPASRRAAGTRAAQPSTPPGTIAVAAPMQGTIIGIVAERGRSLSPESVVLIMDAMKMEHEVRAGIGGTLAELAVAVGDTVFEGDPLAFVEPGEPADAIAVVSEELDLDRIRPDLEEILAQHRKALDESRPAAVAQRRKTGQRTARENIADLCDPGTFREYGGLTVASQWSRHDEDELISLTAADGVVLGTARVNGDLFPDDRAQCSVAAYDYTVVAGTLGGVSMAKLDRLIDVTKKTLRPLVILTEGGGGRPNDDHLPGMASGIASLLISTFSDYAALSGLVPIVGVNSGRCFAGNAILLGLCDAIIATKNSSIGMGGPAMVEGGGLGKFRAEEIGPADVQFANGVVDVLCEDEAEAVAAAKRYVSYFQGTVASWTAPDQRRLRHLIPENRLRVYDVRAVIDGLADEGSVLELRRGFGLGMITSLIRIEGRPLGVIANNPAHLAGAVDSPGADKAARFIQLCNAFDLPVLSLVDTPGMMVGPEVEKTALVRHCARLFLAGTNAKTPFFVVVLRKAYGLGALAMAGGAWSIATLAVSWPTGEFGAMSLEGAIRLGFKKQLEALEPEAREQMFTQMVGELYRLGRARRNAMGPYFDVDDVIDPAETRAWLVSALRAHKPPPERHAKKVPFVDTW